MSVTVTINAQRPEGLLSVEDRQVEGDQLGGSTVRLINSQQNRSLAEPGATVIVERDGTTTHTGVITSTPSSGDGVLTIKTEDRRAELKYETIRQAFYDLPSSQVVKRAVTKQARPLSRTEIHVGSDLAGWTSDAPVFQTYSGSRAGLYNWGTDLIFVGLPSGTSGTVRATFTDVGGRPVADGFYKLLTRFLVANAGGAISAEVEFVTPDGTTYLWEIPDPTDGFEPYELPAQEASPDGEVSETGVLEYRFAIDGELAENRGCWLDAAHTIPFLLKDRNSALSTAGVEPTDRTIRRRADGRTSEFLDELATEDERSWWVEENTLYYRPGGSERAPLSIVEGETPVVDYDLDPDYDDVVNVVTVVGAGDIEVTVSDGQSVDYYGVAARRKTVVDKTIQTEREARDRGRGVLDDQANDDLGMTWTIVDAAYSDLSPGNSLPLIWPSEDLDNAYPVSSVAANEDGTVTVGLSGSSRSRTT